MIGKVILKAQIPQDITISHRPKENNKIAVKKKSFFKQSQMLPAQEREHPRVRRKQYDTPGVYVSVTSSHDSPLPPSLRLLLLLSHAERGMDHFNHLGPRF